MAGASQQEHWQGETLVDRDGLLPVVKFLQSALAMKAKVGAEPQSSAMRRKARFGSGRCLDHDERLCAAVLRTTICWLVPAAVVTYEVLRTVLHTSTAVLVCYCCVTYGNSVRAVGAPETRH